MKIKLCGFFSFVQEGDGVLIRCDDMVFLRSMIGEVRAALREEGLEDNSMVEIVFSEVQDPFGTNLPYAALAYEKGVETSKQVGSVAAYLTEAGLNVEEIQLAKFHHKK